MLQRKQREELDRLVKEGNCKKKDEVKKRSEIITETEILSLEVAGLCHDLGMASC